MALNWVQGFSNKNISFINKQTVCYPCGNYILFLDIETKKTTALQCPAGQVGALAANWNSQVLVFSDHKLNPFIHIYTFPGLSKPTELKGNAQLDYSLLAFSFTGPYLASYSSIPEFALSIWNWQENILLCRESQPGVTATSLSFNPMNWQQLCLINKNSVTVWHIERNNDEHHLKQILVELPDGQESASPPKDLFFPVSHTEDRYDGPDLPFSAITRLVGDEAETFMPRDSAKPSVHPTGHCWAATSEIYLGCEEGYFMAIDAARGSVSALQQKPLPEYACKVSDIVSYVREGQKKKGGNREDPQQSVLFAVAFCNEGLYAAGDGTIYAHKPAHSGEAVKLLDTCSSCFLAADFLTPGDKYCVASAMACCPSSSSVAVGTVRGQIYFLNVTKAEAPRVVQRIFLSKFPVLSLHYDQSGHFLITRAAEGHIFILDARPSKLFQVVGYVDTQHVSNEITKQCYQEILKQKHLRDRAKERKEQSEILQAEAERQRLRTFPIR